MAHDLNKIKQYLLDQWQGDDYYLLQYFPRRSGASNEATDLVIAFKENEEPALVIAEQLLLSAFERMESLLKDEHLARFIVSIPSSRAGGTNEPCERVCRTLARRFDWLTHIPKALVRVETVPKSARAAPGQRPDYSEHLRTIQYKGPALALADQSMIMLDDVLTRGETSRACRSILNTATSSKMVLGAFLGRTR